MQTLYLNIEELNDDWMFPLSRIILLLCPTLVNKTSHKFTGKLGQKVDRTKCGHYKISLNDSF